MEVFYFISSKYFFNAILFCNLRILLKVFCPSLLICAGFLSTGDSNAPGNYALLDQVAALHWIQENIRPFGGNPGDVTLLGHGLGAAVVNLLMTSPVATGQLCTLLCFCYLCRGR